MLLHPEVAGRDCRDCVRHVYQANGERELRFGLPVLRPPNTKPPCGSCAKVPLGAPPVPASAVEWSARNAKAYYHYRECRAVGQWPEDPIIRRNAAIIRQLEDEAAEFLRDQREEQRLARLERLLSQAVRR